VSDEEDINKIEQEEEQPATAAPEEAGPESVQYLTEQLARAREEAADQRDQLLRLAAEFENYKKRIEREKNAALEYAEERIIKELLSSLDNLERALEQGRGGDNKEALVEGVDLTLKGLRDTLGKFGLQPIASVGEPFDPHLHEAMATEESTEIEANRVIREYLKGYLMKERLIRAAKVVVSRSASA